MSFVRKPLARHISSGFIDRTGKILIPAEYGEYPCGDFSDGLVANFKLRDIGETFKFGVDYDGATDPTMLWV